ncbi:MAG: TonB-dependent receptor plug domain-containing protein [Saprospiraceae bacterium]|nr:TonB-dependent receptor plug domain-containing protein [Saprospiraceae bacterium]
MKRVLIYGLFFLFTGKLFSQDTLLFLPDVEVFPESVQFSPYVESWEADSSEIQKYRGQDLSSLLESQSGLLVRSYSPGGLATPSGRGGASRHTVITWNGFNLQSPLNGTLDLSLFPLEFLEAASYHAGGNSSLYGSGSFGGNLVLESEARSETGWHVGVGTSLGSLGLFRPFAKVNFGSTNYAGQVRVLGSTSNNDFKIEGGDRQENGARRDFLISQENTWKINSRNTLKTFAWRQVVDRQLPSSRISSNREEYQKDSILRIGMEWEKRGNNQIHCWRLARIGETTDFGSRIIPSSINTFSSWVGQYTGYLALFQRSGLRFGGQYRLNQLNGDAFNQQTQQLLDIYAAIDYPSQNDKWDYDLGFRLPVADWKIYWPAGHLGISRVLKPGLRLKFGSTYNFTLPTINDLYWVDNFGIGNPNLLPERSWGLDLGLNFIKTDSKNWDNQVQPRVYSQWTYNWIQWQPDGFSGAWSPYNIQSVWSRGIDCRISCTKSEKFWHGGIEILVSLSASELLGVDSLLLDKRYQLAHQPKFQSSFQFWVGYKSMQFSYSDKLIGSRYEFISSNPANKLAPQYQGRLQLSVDKKWKYIGLESFVRIENIWNSYTELFRYFPVPGRQFEIGFYVSH